MPTPIRDPRDRSPSTLLLTLLALASTALACGPGEEDPVSEALDADEQAATRADMGTSGDAANTFAAATVPGALSGTGGLNSTDTNDYFRIELRAGDRLRATMTPPSTANFDLRILDPSGSVAAASTGGLGAVERAEVTAGTSGAWRVRVNRVRGRGVYSLSIVIERAGVPDAGVADSGARVDSGVQVDSGVPADSGVLADSGAREDAGGAPDAGAPGCTTASSVGAHDVQVSSFTAQAGSFTVEWDVTPGAADNDSAIGLSQGSPSYWSQLVTAVRFANGMIDARNGAAYAAVTSVPFTPGATYHVREVVDVPARRYSAFVKAAGGAEQAIAVDYAFRSDVTSVDSLDHYAVIAEPGTLTACGFTLTGDSTPPDPEPICGDRACNGAETCSSCSADCGSCGGATYYVATNGSDGAAGTSAAPWRTIQHAIDTAPSGATVIIRSGTYDQALRFTDKQNLTLRGEGATKPHIRASSSDNVVWFYWNAEGGRLQNLEISGGNYYAVKIDQPRVVVEDCKLHDSGADVVKITPGSDDVIIRRNEIYGSGRVNPGNAQGIDSVNTDRLLVQDNYIHDTATEGVFSKGGSIGAVIERNRVVNAGSSNPAAGITAGICGTDWDVFDYAINPEMHECIDCVIRNNIVIGATAAGIGLLASKGTRVYSNTLIGVANGYQAGLFVAGCENWPNGGGRIFIPNQDLNVANNVFSVASASRPVVLIAGDAAEPGLRGTITIDSNRYYAGGGAPRYADERNGFYGGFAGWRTHISGDQRSSEGDPGVDATGHLIAGSACVDAGQTVSGFSDDLDREARPRGAAWDVGADER